MLVQRLGRQGALQLARCLAPLASRAIASWATVDPTKLSGSNPATVSNLGACIASAGGCTVACHGLEGGLSSEACGGHQL